MQNTTWLQTAAAGATGAVTVNVLNEVVRHFDPKAPRLDLLGIRGLAKLLGRHQKPDPRNEDLRLPALAGDLVSNTAYYSLVPLIGKQQPFAAGAALGALAGVLAAFSPPVADIDNDVTARTPRTVLMTVLWYLAGGLAAAAVIQGTSTKS